MAYTRLTKKISPFDLYFQCSAQHELAKYLTGLLQPVLDIYSSNCVKDSFFAHEIQQLDTEPSNSFLCSFDISSLFTNVTLAETIQVYADTLYNGKLIPIDFPENIFIEHSHIFSRI